jgi:DNA-directed RNA polymerase specialized sigma24 family protein
MPAPESWKETVLRFRVFSNRNEGQEFVPPTAPEWLKEAVRLLPRQHAEIFCDVYYHRMTLDDVARKMNLSPVRVQAIHARALRMLRRLLKPQT